MISKKVGQRLFRVFGVVIVLASAVTALGFVLMGVTGAGLNGGRGMGVVMTLLAVPALVPAVWVVWSVLRSPRSATVAVSGTGLVLTPPDAPDRRIEVSWSEIASVELRPLRQVIGEEWSGTVPRRRHEEPFLRIALIAGSRLPTEALDRLFHAEGDRTWRVELGLADVHLLGREIDRMRTAGSVTRRGLGAGEAVAPSDGLRVEGERMRPSPASMYRLVAVLVGIAVLAAGACAWLVSWTLRYWPRPDTVASAGVAMWVGLITAMVVLAVMAARRDGGAWIRIGPTGVEVGGRSASVVVPRAEIQRIEVLSHDPLRPDRDLPHLELALRPDSLFHGHPLLGTLTSVPLVDDLEVYRLSLSSYDLTEVERRIHESGLVRSPRPPQIRVAGRDVV